MYSRRWVGAVLSKECGLLAVSGAHFTAADGYGELAPQGGYEATPPTGGYGPPPSGALPYATAPPKTV